MPDGFPILLLVGFFVLMWLLFIRPQQRRQRELAHMQGSLEVGDEVLLTSGVYGVLHEIEDDSVRLEVADGVVIRVARAAVGRMVQPIDDAVDDDADADDAADAPTSTEPNRDADVPEET